eukprot:8365488-Pyramimonas_sp.AAC.1
MGFALMISMMRLRITRKFARSPEHRLFLHFLIVRIEPPILRRGYCYYTGASFTPPPSSFRLILRFTQTQTESYSDSLIL